MAEEAPLIKSFRKQYLIYGAIALGITAFGALIWYMEKRSAAASAANAAQETALLSNLMQNSAYQNTLGANLTGTAGYGYDPFGGGGGAAGAGYVASPSQSGTDTGSTVSTSGSSDLASQISSMLTSFTQQQQAQSTALQTAINTYSNASNNPLNAEITSLQKQVSNLTQTNQTLTSDQANAHAAWNSIENLANNPSVYGNIRDWGRLNTALGTVVRNYQGQAGV